MDNKIKSRPEGGQERQEITAQNTTRNPNHLVHFVPVLTHSEAQAQEIYVLPPRLSQADVMAKAFEMTPEELTLAGAPSWYSDIDVVAKKYGARPVLIAWPDNSIALFFLSNELAAVPETYAMGAYTAVRELRERRLKGVGDVH